MAIYHCEIKNISRRSGRSSVAAAAYRSGDDLTNESDGVRHDYTRKEGIIYSEISAPDHAPDWALSRNELWNEVERIEDDGDARTAREFEIALPNELNKEQQVALVKEFAKVLNDQGMVTDWSIHDKHDKNSKKSKEPKKKKTIEVDAETKKPLREPSADAKNVHVHMMATTRPFEKDGTWGQKARKEYVLDENGQKIKMPNKKNPKGRPTIKSRCIDTTDWNKVETLEKWRETWANIANKHLEKAGLEIRIDHRSNEDRGLDEKPTIHLGVKATAMERRGEHTRKGDINREISESNKQLKAAKARLKVLNARKTELENQLKQEKNAAQEKDRLEIYNQIQEDVTKTIAESKKITEDLRNVSEVNLKDVRELFKPAMHDAAGRIFNQNNKELKERLTKQEESLLIRVAIHNEDTVGRLKGSLTWGKSDYEKNAENLREESVKLQSERANFNTKRDSFIQKMVNNDGSLTQFDNDLGKVDKLAREIMTQKDPDFTPKYDAAYKEYLAITSTSNQVSRTTNTLNKLDIDQNPHIKKYIEYSKLGLDEKGIVKKMLTVDKFDNKDIINAIMQESRECPNMSDKAFKYAKDIVKEVEKSQTKGGSKGKGGGMTAGRGGSERDKNIKIDLSILLPQDVQMTSLTARSEEEDLEITEWDSDVSRAEKIAKMSED